MAPQVYRNMFDAAVGITKGKGVRGLYSGLGVTMVEIMPYAALQFGLYDALQSAWKGARVRHREGRVGAEGITQGKKEVVPQPILQLRLHGTLKPAWEGARMRCQPVHVLCGAPF